MENEKRECKACHISYMWIVAFVGIFMAMLQLFSCGSEEKESDDSETGSVATQFLQLNPFGLNKIATNNEEDNYSCSFTVERQGKNTDGDLTAKLSFWGESELKRYNSDEETSYVLLPERLYTINKSDITLASGQASTDVEIHFDPSAVFEEIKKTNAQYIIGVRLSSDEAKIVSSQRDFIAEILLSYPRIAFKAMPNVLSVSVNEAATEVEIPTSFTYEEGGVNLGCQWAFSCKLEVPANAAELVTQYNEKNHSAYELLPVDAYNLGEGVTYEAGGTQASGSISVFRDQLGSATYLLPLTLTGFSNESVLFDNEIFYVAFSRTFSNPVLDGNHPDPTVFRAPDGNFYLYCTESSGDDGGMGIYRSADLVQWEHVGKVITGNYLNWTDLKKSDLWAPEIRYINGKYVVYFSVSSWGGLDTSKIGVATSDSPKGPFTDSGKALITYDDLGVLNSIDPFYWEEDGKKYLFWGSFHGLYVTELTDDGLSVKKDGAGKPTLLQQVAGSAFEATCIYKRNGYYYLFASVGSCCDGANSSYRVVVGRSTDLFGPYVDKSGNKMLNNKYELVLQGNDYWAGPGHNSQILVDDAGTEWMIYHGRPLPDADVRSVLLDRLLWTDDGWPYIKNAEPSEMELIPSFN